jgi:hypothetical protein
MTTDIPATIQPYEIVSVKRTDPPSGMEGSGWHHYIISQGGNRISGYRQGTLTAVTSAVEEIVGQLNERQLGKRGRVNLVPAPKKRAQ